MVGFGACGDLDALVSSRLAQAISLRRRIVGPDTTCMRLVNGDGDGLSGLVVDQYAGVLVVQLLTAGMDRMREQVLRMLLEVLAPHSIIERSAGSVRREEGLADRSGLLAGEPVDEVAAIENGFKLAVAPGRGQKTGYFLGQRENRRRWGGPAGGAPVCGAGGFGA